MNSNTTTLSSRFCFCQFSFYACISFKKEVLYSTYYSLTMSNTKQIIKDDNPSTSPIKKGSSKSSPNVVSPFFKPKYKPPHTTATEETQQEAGNNKEKAAPRVKYMEGIKEGSGSYAILRILWEHKEKTLTKHEILEFGQKYCKNVLEPTVKIEQGSRIQGSSTIGFGSWSSKKTLLKYELIEKCKRKREDAYKLSKDGLKLVPDMLERIETARTAKAPPERSGPGSSKQQQTSSSPVKQMPMMKPSYESSLKKQQQQQVASSSSSSSVATVTPTKKMTPAGISSSDKSTPPSSKKRNASSSDDIRSFFSVVKKSRKK